MKPHFKGYYYKHQNGPHTLCVIVGRCRTEQFIQIITENFSAEVPFTNENIFTRQGIHLKIQTDEISLKGSIRYHTLTPIQYDIMGPFRFFSMECRHGIISMRHCLEGQVVLNGEKIDFTGGTGYIEMDSGDSFPSSYTWIQANQFSEPCSIMASVANIPFLGLHFPGCICVIQYKCREYRLATYLGVRILLCAQDRILLKQGRYILDVQIILRNAKELKAPRKDGMTRTILEAAACDAEFRFYENGKLLFHLRSRQTSFECERCDIS